MLLLVVGCTAPATERAADRLSEADRRQAQYFQQVVRDLADPAMEGRGIGTAGLERARDYLVQQFDARGLEPAVRAAGEARYTQPFTFDPETAALAGMVVRGHGGRDGQGQRDSSTSDTSQAANVVGYAPGAGALQEQVIVVAAHYDHLGFGGAGSRARPNGRDQLHPGADDNASGVAGLLLAAEHHQRFIHANPERPRRTVLFLATAAEELGLHGAMHFVEHPDELAVPLENITAMLNLDMIGRLHRTLYVFGTDSSAQWPPMLADVDASLNDAPLLAALRIEQRGAVTVLGDHAVFHNELGLPVLHFFTGLHGDYHRPSDTADRINAVGGAAVAQVVARVLERLATRAEPITPTPTRLRRRLPADVWRR